ncbi:MAG TPA: tetratricopeptide repeat protein [Candidatus Acidoferrum sp.]|nr:tetratricopeptide repeat protein [Candidatus Acidoferrum sp.]
MVFRITTDPVLLALFLCIAFLYNGAFAQRPNPGSTDRQGEGPSSLAGDIDIYVKGADGGPIEVIAVVTLVAPTGQVLTQGTTIGGHIQFRGVAASDYTIQVVAPGYEAAAQEFPANNSRASTIIIDMQPASNGKIGAGSSQILLSPKAEKELGKAREALRVNKPGQARSHLEAAYSKAPNHPAVNYLYGVYFLQMKDQEKAKSYWAKALEFDPKHVPALLSLSQALMREQKLAEAKRYVKRAVEVDPNSWRAHAILADILMTEHVPEEAIKEANHALELGHGQAAIVQPLLARALAEGGNKERAIKVLGEYVQDHPDDTVARKQLENSRSSDIVISNDKEAASTEVKLTTATESAIALPLPSNWLPPDVDENVPPVEPGVACLLNEVVQKAGKRVEEFITNVDRFSANELLRHESINKWGLAKLPETLKFDYVVSIEQYRPGYFDVIEYRGNKYSPAQFPDGVETRGLPSMLLIFHSNNAGNFAMSCEGLGQWNGMPAWQIHFRQRPDKPNTIQAYKYGENGPSYPVALRGRAWIAADSYQIVRIETDLVATLPEIRLFADHTVVEYSPVRFKDRNVEMWLPQSAELYCDWRGKRMHRRHSFSNYMLFSVDEKQHISEPKTETKNQTEN